MESVYFVVYNRGEPLKILRAKYIIYGEHLIFEKEHNIVPAVINCNCSTPTSDNATLTCQVLVTFYAVRC